MYACVHCTCIVSLKVKQQQKTSADDGILPSPFVIDEGDNGRVSQQNALFFSQKVQHVPGRNFITSQFYYIAILLHHIKIFNDCAVNNIDGAIAEYFYVM